LRGGLRGGGGPGVRGFPAGLDLYDIHIGTI